MTNVQNIYDFINGFAPFENAMEFDNVGLLLGDKKKQVKTVLVALDITKEVIEEANSLDADLIVTHHPIIFNAMKRILSDNLQYRLIQYDISVISAHTNLDIAQPFGVNTALADALELQNAKFIDSSLPIVTGCLKEEMSAEAFEKFVSQKLLNPHTRSNYKKIEKKIKTVAVGGGACGEYTSFIAQNEYDAFVTGELKHHEFLCATDFGLMAVDAGHFYTENVVIQPLAQKISEEFKDITVYVSKVENGF